ncbi:hypothetical protein Tco_0370356 [Tanacetum coccineum]
MENRRNKAKTPFTPPPRSPKIGLSLEKALTIKLSKEPVPMSDVPSHSSLHHTKPLRGRSETLLRRKSFHLLKTQKIALSRPIFDVSLKSNCTWKQLTHVVPFKPPISTFIPALQERLCRAMKDRPYAQTTDPDMWATLKHGNSETKKYILSMHKFHANPFLKDDLEELLTRLLGRVFTEFNEEACLSIQH